MIFGMLFHLSEYSSNLNRRGYDCLLQYQVVLGLRVWNGGNLNRLWWQQDGTTLHVTDANAQHPLLGQAA